MATTTQPPPYPAFPAFPRLPHVPSENDDPYERAFRRHIETMFNELSKRLQGYHQTPVAITTFAATDVAAPIVFATPQPDTRYQISITPAWNTTTWMSAITVNGFTLNVGTAPGGAGGDVRWALTR